MDRRVAKMTAITGTLIGALFAATVVTGCAETTNDECEDTIESSAMVTGKSGGSSGGRGGSGFKPAPKPVHIGKAPKQNGSSGSSSGGSSSGGKHKSGKIKIDSEDCD